MKSLIEKINEAENSGTAIGHFNISDLSALKAIFESALFLKLPVIIGLSEGERDFVGVAQAVALVKSLREKYDFPIFINADHTKSLEKIKEAVEAGFDAVMFDGGSLPFEENIRKTKEAVDWAKNINGNILVEGEIGYIRGRSELIKEEEGIIKEENLTKPEEAVEFIKETGVDLLAPSVGNIHGMLAPLNSAGIFSGFKNVPSPNLDILRIKQIKGFAGMTPLVLHGGSGIKNEDILAAIGAGISVIHINTELRLAWRRSLEGSLREKPEEITPYKILPPVVEAIKQIVSERLKLFNKSI